MKRIVLGLLLMAAPAAGQDTLRLPVLQDAAVMRDPRVRQAALQEAATEIRLRDIAVERLPALRVTGEATRLSEVAALPISLPGTEVLTPPRDRLDLGLDAEWLLFDGGSGGARRSVERAALSAVRAELAAELYPLRIEVVEAFFDALLLQERIRAMSTLVEDLEARLAEVRQGVAAGAALPGDTASVRAEMLRAMQQRSELTAERAAALDVLERLTGRVLAPDDVLAAPELADDLARVRRTPGAAERGPGDPPLPRVHPRFAVFEALRERLDRESAATRAGSRPRISAFGRYAYGRPGYRQFTDELHDYWLGGVRIRWAPWDWGAIDRELQTLRIRREILETEEAAFSERLQRQLRRPLHAIDRLEAALATDEQIIALREQVERQARAQLAERAVTPAGYIDARTDLQDARIALLRHRIELARARAIYLTTLGVELR